MKKASALVEAIFRDATRAGGDVIAAVLTVWFDGRPVRVWYGGEDETTRVWEVCIASADSTLVQAYVPGAEHHSTHVNGDAVYRVRVMKESNG